MEWEGKGQFRSIATSVPIFLYTLLACLLPLSLLDFCADKQIKDCLDFCKTRTLHFIIIQNEELRLLGNAQTDEISQSSE